MLVPYGCGGTHRFGSSLLGLSWLRMAVGLGWCDAWSALASQHFEVAHRWLLYTMGQGTHGLLNRLDRETVGPVVGIKKEDTYLQLKKMRDHHGWHKEYLCLVRGRMPVKSWERLRLVLCTS
eukprot:gnl/TRDRNA2_/TRDRNA2_53780_c1_seq1.p1 gnl/TRDRNA2_/TRDRNA2_53780_c1~~gnl/TRDRNA2_/TRDRNA2_53780_c1_seq1.p1  ORF type:complete len:122 (-),score=10.18 gnl/TRDRNA2_/TRDRNA2_53780_c1_seq1:68-433(-)